METNCFRIVFWSLVFLVSDLDLAQAQNKYLVKRVPEVFGTVASAGEVCKILQHSYFYSKPDEISRYLQSRRRWLEPDPNWLKTRMQEKGVKGTYSFEIEISTKTDIAVSIGNCLKNLYLADAQKYQILRSNFPNLPDGNSCVLSVNQCAHGLLLRQSAFVSLLGLKEASLFLNQYLDGEVAVINQQNLAEAKKLEEQQKRKAADLAEIEQANRAAEAAKAAEAKEKPKKLLEEAYAVYQTLDICGKPKNYSLKGFENLKYYVRTAEQESKLNDTEQKALWEYVNKGLLGMKISSACPAAVAQAEFWFAAVSPAIDTMRDVQKDLEKGAPAKPKF